MSLRISNKRKAVVIDYSDDQDEVVGDGVHVRAENVDTGKVGERSEQNNDGEVVLFYPADFTGEDEVTITGSESGEVTGTISV